VIAVQTLQHTTFGLDVYSREKLDLHHGTHTDGLLCMVTDGLTDGLTDGNRWLAQIILTKGLSRIGSLWG
jgi:hypothetical protein